MLDRIRAGRDLASPCRIYICSCWNRPRLSDWVIVTTVSSSRQSKSRFVCSRNGTSGVIAGNDSHEIRQAAFFSQISKEQSCQILLAGRFLKNGRRRCRGEFDSSTSGSWGQRSSSIGTDRLRTAWPLVFRGCRLCLRSRSRRLAIAAEKSGVDAAHASTDLRRILDDPAHRCSSHRRLRSLACPGSHSWPVRRASMSTSRNRAATISARPNLLLRGGSTKQRRRATRHPAAEHSPLRSRPSRSSTKE